ncbi:hypothetical protein Ctob_013337 [Chrysochromulina tobinii]|uniref:Uncharacterized protein n=1 Tax=Chrysochromulina tobinii TaxID=1460289 RepID=A0A0M0LPM5_9EUKA|nr:hypothetical protein Ctob_013337 [Chrysochromulina tobinii]|eukprot:KOO52862.1 hypothetical protein Ctob_013337 [Chrysochromulina sp. CCMP291]
MPAAVRIQRQPIARPRPPVGAPSRAAALAPPVIDYLTPSAAPAARPPSNVPSAAAKPNCSSGDAYEDFLASMNGLL